MTDVFQQVFSYIQASEPVRFESLALSVFRYQARHVPVYREYLACLGIDPRRIRSFRDIPPISTLAFKYARIENELHPEGLGSRVFFTSGTSIGRNERGHHLVPVAQIYRLSAMRHLRCMLFPDKTRIAMLALHPCASRMPESSLAQMITWCVDEFGDGTALYAATPESVEVAPAIEFLQAVRRVNDPVCILGTTASCAKLFGALRQGDTSIPLPPGSRLMDTGGAKGQLIPLAPDQVIAEAKELLGIEPPLVINEYGMTEMCSQLYDATSFNSDLNTAPGMRIKLAPPWLRPAAIDPLTLKPTKKGQPGMLAFFDLANVGSVSALVTEDIGIVQGDCVMVLGRAGSADPRGCALAIQQFAETGKAGPPLESRKDSGRLAAVVWQHDQAPEARDAMLLPSVIEAASKRIRQTLQTRPARICPEATATVYPELMETVINGSGRWRQAISRIAASCGYSESLLGVSLQALLSGLGDAGEFARKLNRRRELLGFIMPGNVPGAGIHELLATLAAGCGALVKTSSAEPIFFKELAKTLRELDCGHGTDFAARLEVFSWERGRTDLTEAMLKNCDRVVVLGDDVTIGQLQKLAGPLQPIAFGSRFSAAAVLREAVQAGAMKQTAEALALDCAMFDQRGCLSPHHLFVEARACEFAGEIAAALSRLNATLGAKRRGLRMGLQTATAIRRARETARWHQLGGANVRLWEDPDFQWTVVFDDAARFTMSPTFQTLYVSQFSSPSDLERRLEPVHGRLEGFAIAADSAVRTAGGTSSPRGTENQPRSRAVRKVAERCGATYVCAPGALQSPPLDWPHGGGQFIQMFIG